MATRPKRDNEQDAQSAEVRTSKVGGVRDTASKLTLPDVLEPGIRLLFIGFNPSVRAAELGYHYSGRNNEFWRLLAGAELTPRLLAPMEDHSVSQWGIGLTNLSSRPTPTAADLPLAELRAGVPRLRSLVLKFRPEIVAYTGKGVYLAATRLKRAPWGLQPESLFWNARDFVLPSSSGLVRMSFAEKLEHYRALHHLQKELTNPDPRDNS